MVEDVCCTAARCVTMHLSEYAEGLLRYLSAAVCGNMVCIVNLSGLLPTCLDRNRFQHVDAIMYVGCQTCAAAANPWNSVRMLCIARTEHFHPVWLRAMAGWLKRSPSVQHFNGLSLRYFPAVQ